MAKGRAGSGEIAFWMTLAVAGAIALVAIVSGVWRPKATVQIPILGPAEARRLAAARNWRPNIGSIGRLGLPGHKGHNVWLCKHLILAPDMVTAEEDWFKGGRGAGFQLRKMIKEGIVKALIYLTHQDDSLPH